jgi:MFS family permease
MSIFQVGGQFVFGLLSDSKVPLDVLASVSTIVAAIACFAIWRLAESLPVLIVFAIVYGFFGAGFTAIWARMSMSVTDDDTAGPIVFSLLNFGKGVGNVLAGPIGGALVAEGERGVEGMLEYRWVVVFTGTCIFASAGMIWLGQLKHLRLLKPE